MDLDGAVVIVTGASRGVGRALAVALGRQGASVACVARATDAHPVPLPGTVDGTARLVDAAGGVGLAVGADLSRPDEVEGAVARTIERFGRVDVLVNNAAITFAGDLALTRRRHDLMFAVNVTAPLVATQAVVPIMTEGGRIVNVSSRAALEYYAGMMGYGMTKAALEHLTVSAAAQLVDRRIAVNAFRIDVPVASEGYVLNSPGVDKSGWMAPAVAAEGLLWMIHQPLTYTGRLESMRDLADREGILTGARGSPRLDPQRWALSRARGEADPRY